MIIKLLNKNYFPQYYNNGKHKNNKAFFAIFILFLFSNLIFLVMWFRNASNTFPLFLALLLAFPTSLTFLYNIKRINTNKRFKKLVREAILDRGNQGIHKLKNIASEIGMNPNDILCVLLDLRDKGLISYQYNSETGEIILQNIFENLSSKNQIISLTKFEKSKLTEDINYCLYCGYKLQGKDDYCKNCSSKI
ncbi:hypothetical protein ES705_04906 [subsurface metagenome]